jgi:hypothetical protein
MKRGNNRDESTRWLVRAGSARGEGEFPIIDDLNLWFRSFRDKLSRLEIICEKCKKVSLGFALFSAELKQSSRKRDCFDGALISSARTLVSPEASFGRLS